MIKKAVETSGTNAYLMVVTSERYRRARVLIYDAFDMERLPVKRISVGSRSFRVGRRGFTNPVILTAKELTWEGITFKVGNDKSRS